MITDGPEYSLQTADMSGKAVTIRVITGCKAKSVRNSFWAVYAKLSSDLGQSSQVRQEGCVRVIQILRVFGYIAAP